MRSVAGGHHAVLVRGRVVSLRRVASPTSDDLAATAAVSPASASRRPSRLRVQLVLLAVAVVVSGFGAIAWANWFGPAPAPLDAHFERPGEYPLSGDTGNRPVGGEPLPLVALRSSDDDGVVLRSDGRPMVVNVWAENCKPCEEELKYFAAVDADHSEEQVRFVGVNVNLLTTLDEMVDFAGARGVDYELLLDDTGQWSQALRVVALPLTLFVDADGRIVSQAGQVDEQQLRSYVAELLAGSGPPA